MIKKRVNPFDECPIIETRHFVFRLVKEEDTKDLLSCYSDNKSAKIFNSDNCSNNFVCKTEEELREMIKFWIIEYKNHGYVRFSLVDKAKMVVIGTIEIFAKKETFEEFGKVGLLRIDLASAYENEEDITEILMMVDKNFPVLFEINSITTKAIPFANKRVNALKLNGFVELENRNVTTYSDYHIKVWKK